MAIKTNTLIDMVISLILVALLLPIGIINIASIGDSAVTINGTVVGWSDVVDPTVTTLLAVILPVIVGIAIMSAFIYKARSK